MATKLRLFDEVNICFIAVWWVVGCNKLDTTHAHCSPDNRFSSSREKKHFIESKEEKKPLLKDTVRESEKILLYKDKRFRRKSV